MTQPLSWGEAQGQKQELTTEISVLETTPRFYLCYLIFRTNVKKKTLKHTHDPTNPENEKSQKEL